MIRKADKQLKAVWKWRFSKLPPEAREVLRLCLMDLREDALERAKLQWRRHKAPMALYWKVVGVYAGHLARALRASEDKKFQRWQKDSEIYQGAPTTEQIGRETSSMRRPWEDLLSPLDIADDPK